MVKTGLVLTASSDSMFSNEPWLSKCALATASRLAALIPGRIEIMADTHSEVPLSVKASGFSVVVLTSRCADITAQPPVVGLKFENVRNVFAYPDGRRSRSRRRTRRRRDTNNVAAVAVQGMFAAGGSSDVLAVALVAVVTLTSLSEPLHASLTIRTTCAALLAPMAVKLTVVFASVPAAILPNTVKRRTVLLTAVPREVHPAGVLPSAVAVRLANNTSKRSPAATAAGIVTGCAWAVSALTRDSPIDAVGTRLKSGKTSESSCCCHCGGSPGPAGRVSIVASTVRQSSTSEFFAVDGFGRSLGSMLAEMTFW